MHAALREEGIPASLINSRFAKPLDTQMLMEAASKHTLVVTMEENVIMVASGSISPVFITNRESM